MVHDNISRPTFKMMGNRFWVHFFLWNRRGPPATDYILKSKHKDLQE
jgi:hypothetical protein